MRFIKLTTSDTQTPFWVNPEEITAMYQAGSSDDEIVVSGGQKVQRYTILYYCSTNLHAWNVSETPEEIMALVAGAATPKRKKK